MAGALAGILAARFHNGRDQFAAQCSGLVSNPDPTMQLWLADDWLHSVLQLWLAVVGIYAGCLVASPAPRRASPGRQRAVPGPRLLWLRPGFLLGTPFAIPLASPKNLFHFTLSPPALAILLLHWAGRSRRAPPANHRHASA